MKKFLVFLLTGCMLLSVTAGCNPIDEDYGVSSTASTASKVVVSYPEDIEPPTIKSLDTKMSLFFDLSLYDEENYSQIYLGKDYKISALYEGIGIVLPTTLDTLNHKDWDFAPGQSYTDDSVINAGLMVEALFVNKQKKKMTVFFYNEETTSVKLTECPIVRITIPHNGLVIDDSSYGDFNINGVDNSSAITDVIQALGAPSHFHADSKTEYTLDWFKSADDRRNKISVSISLDDDCVTSVSYSNYISE